MNEDTEATQDVPAPAPKQTEDWVEEQKEEKEPEEDEVRKYGDIYVEDIKEKLFRRVIFTAAVASTKGTEEGEQAEQLEQLEQLEVILYRLGYIDMISVSGCSVPLSDFLNIEYLGYWEQDWISIHLKSRHALHIPRISNDMMIQCLSYISRYPYEIPEEEEDDTSGDSEACLSMIGVLLVLAAIVLWVYYLSIGTSLIHAHGASRDEL